jgi:drug/metabolite transporter (DMT)-like permease
MALTAVHALCTLAGTHALLAAGVFESPPLPLWPVVRIALCGVCSVVLMNLNLSLNTIGIYQASKILVVPATALLERMWYGKSQGWRVWATLVVVLLGVMLSAPPGVLESLQESQASFLGLATAAAAVLVAASAVILIGATQKQLTASPLALLHAQQPFVIVYAVAMACIFEDVPYAALAAASSWRTAGLIAATGAISIALNVSGFMAIQLLSPLTYQVTSHLKPILTIVLGVAVFGEAVSGLQAAGFALSIAGIAAYTAVKTRTSHESAKPSRLTAPRIPCALLRWLAIPASLLTWHVLSCSSHMMNMPWPSFFFTASVPPPRRGNWDVIVCSHARMEAPFLREWVLWNYAAGVQHFVIFDNNDAAPGGLSDAFDEALAPFPKSLITILRYPRDVMNNPALAETYGLNRSDFENLDLTMDNPLKQRCYDIYRSSAKWIALIDVDEVFVALQNLTLPAFLAEPQIAEDKSIGGVGVFWRFSHYSGHFLRPKHNLLENFDLCEYHEANKHIKTIARASTMEPTVTIVNAHYMEYHHGYRCVTEPSLLEEGCDIAEHLLNNNWKRPVSVHFQLNHLFSRSVEDFVIKALRGSYFGEKRNNDLHLHHIRGAAYGSNCFRTQDEPSLRAAKHVAALRAELNIPLYIPGSRMPPISKDFRMWSPSLGAFYDAIQARLTWDEAYYLSANAGRPECLPSPPMDGLMRFWADDKANNETCAFRFV